MHKTPEHHFLLRIAFLGFRFHGWQEQPGQRTVAGMIRKTFRFVLPDTPVKILGAGRTDARVSARDFAVQVIAKCPELPAFEVLAEALNANLPPDIRVHSIQPVPAGFNPIRDCTSKTYCYYFQTGNPPDAYLTPFVGFLPGSPDISRMREAAPIFEGTHNFRCFTASPSGDKKYTRRVDRCRLGMGYPLEGKGESGIPGNGNGLPANMLEVRAPGFGRNQVRLMVAALAAVGRQELDPVTLAKVLEEGRGWMSDSIVPASGLHLVRVEFKDGTA